MKSLHFEQELTSQSVTWKYAEKVKFRAIDRAAGLRNQARPEAINEDLVLQYLDMRKAGLEPPAVVLWNTGRRLVPMDGNQRLEAAGRDGAKHVDAYIVTCEKEVADRITWVFNQKVNGQRLTTESCIEHAVTMVRKYGASEEQAAKEWGLRKWQVNYRIREMKLREAAEAQGVSTRAIPSSTVVKLSPLHDLGDDIYVPAVRTIAESGGTEADVTRLLKDVKAARTHAGKVAAVGEFASSEAMAARRAETKGGTIKRKSPPPRDTARRGIDALNRLFAGFARDAFRVSDRAWMKTVREAGAELVQHLLRIYGVSSVGTDHEEGVA